MERSSSQVTKAASDRLQVASRFRNPDNDPRGPYILADVTSPFERPAQRYEWNGYLPPEGRSWRYSAERVRSLQDDGRIVFSSSGKPRLKRYLTEAQRREVDESAALQEAPRSTVEIIVRSAMRALAAAVARNPKCLQSIEWRDMERLLREVFEELGFTTELTRPGKDGGFDLKLQCEEAGQASVFLVEVKHWAEGGKRPGPGVFKAFFDIVAKQARGTTGLLLSSSGFTSKLAHERTEIEQQMVRLGGENKIVSLCQSYLESSSGVWSPTTDFAEMLFQGTD